MNDKYQWRYPAGVNAVYLVEKSSSEVLEMIHFKYPNVCDVVYEWDFRTFLDLGLLKAKIEEIYATR